MLETIETVNSPINGEIRVIQDDSGIYLECQGSIPCGTYAVNTWTYCLKPVKDRKPTVSSLLVLGFTGGSCVTAAKTYWDIKKIDGVDIDPVIVNIAKKYFDTSGVNVIIDDAYDYCSTITTSYDLIILDCFIGPKIPSKFDNYSFISLLKKILSPDGILVMNRFYLNGEGYEVDPFIPVVKNVFTSVDTIRSADNFMLICQ